MYFQAIISIFAFQFSFNYATAQAGECSAGWTQYADEKCYKLHKSFSTATDAIETCKASGGTLATIHEIEKQEFLQNLLFGESQVEIGVWIGLFRKSTTEFLWIDETPLQFANWGVGSPTELDGRNCVVMQSKFSKTNHKDEILKLEDVEGKWKDVSCQSPNYFVCEQPPTWTKLELQLELIATRKELGLLKATVDNIIKNPVPIGFLYTELPNSPSPQTIWPNLMWENVSPLFQGLFFRVEGGTSAGFGATQEERTKTLKNVQTGGAPNYNPPGSAWGNIAMIPGSWSAWATTGYSHEVNAKVHTEKIRFETTNDEVRPRNTAVRIWKRIQ
jgi:hypothetical protein